MNTGELLIEGCEAVIRRARGGSEVISMGIQTHRHFHRVKAPPRTSKRPLEDLLVVG